MLHFTSGESLLNLQKLSKYYEHDSLQFFFFFAFMSLLTALTVKNGHILAGIYFILLEELFRPNSKVFQYYISTSMKKTEKLLLSKTNFSAFL